MLQSAFKCSSCPLCDADILDFSFHEMYESRNEREHDERMDKLPSKVIICSRSSCSLQSLMFSSPSLSYIFKAPITGTRTPEISEVMPTFRFHAMNEMKPAWRFSPPLYWQQSIIYLRSKYVRCFGNHKSSLPQWRCWSGTGPGSSFTSYWLSILNSVMSAPKDMFG